MDNTTATTKKIITDALEQFNSRGNLTGFVFFGYSHGDKVYYCIWADSRRSEPQNKLMSAEPHSVLDFALNLVEAEHAHFVHMPDR